MENKYKDSTLSLLRRLFREYVRHHYGKIGLASICMIIIALTTAANAWIMQPVMDQIFFEKNAKLLLAIPFAVLGLALLKGAATYVNNFIMAVVGHQIVTDMQMKMYNHLLYSDISLFDRTSTGTLISRFSNDTQIIRRSLNQIMVGIIKELFTTIFLVTLMFMQSFELACFSFIFMAVIYPIVRIGKRMRKLSTKTQEELGAMTARLEDSFSSIRIVKAYCGEEREAAKTRNVADNIFALYRKIARTASAISPLMETLAGMAIAGVIWYGGKQVIDGVTTPGAFFSFVAAMLMAYKPVKSLTGSNSSIQEGLAAMKRLFELLDTQPAIKDSPDAKPLILGKAEIEFRDVYFRYNGSEKSALNGLTITVPAGKRVALVGKSGAGKSTIMNLIMRFYDINSGEILIGGHDIRNVTIKSLRDNIAVVNQEATLFDDTIRANIMYGCPHATESQMKEAAISAAADYFIMEQPKGYDTQIGQHGVRLSGGQKQRIAIARAMLCNAPILLLDEATSSLDTISEQQIQQALSRLMAGRTTLIIAHRLSTVMNTDIIYVIDNGQVIESGTHSELLARNGAYKALYDKQFNI